MVSAEGTKNGSLTKKARNELMNLPSGILGDFLSVHLQASFLNLLKCFYSTMVKPEHPGRN